MGANRIEALFVVLGGLFAWLVATLAIAGSTSWPLAVIVPLTSVFGLLVGAVSRAIAGWPSRGWPGVAGRVAVGLAVGVVVGELAAVALFSGAIDRDLDEQAAMRADAAPAVAQASADLAAAREARTALDGAVQEAQRQRDDALVVARCEFNPSPACPQTHITGVPGPGPENRTANDFLGDTQRQLDTAVAEHDRRAVDLDVRIATDEHTLAEARTTAAQDVDRGFGARWTAMNGHTVGSPTALLLRLLTIAFFALVYLLPLILRLWRGETTHDRGAGARAERERAELEADTVIAVKRAEVRAAVETMWAEQQLASARLAVEAQQEIDREQQRRRVVEALGAAEPAAVQARAERVAPAGLEAAAGLEAEDETTTSDNLPARREGSGSLIPTLPDVTKAATRWIRPFVPPIVAGAVETATKPLRGVRQIFEEEEELHISLKRSRKVTVHTEQDDPDAPAKLPEQRARRSVASERHEPIEVRMRELPPAE